MSRGSSGRAFGTSSPAPAHARFAELCLGAGGVGRSVGPAGRPSPITTAPRPPLARPWIASRPVAASGVASAIGGELVAGDGAGRGRNPFTEQTIATVNAPSDEQLGATVAAARESSREWMHAAVDRGELLHEVANRIESAPTSWPDDDAGGGQAADREPRRGQLGGRLLPLLRRDRPRLGGARDPPSSPLRLAMVLEAARGLGCIVPWNYPLLLLVPDTPRWRPATPPSAGNPRGDPLSTLMLAPCVEHLPAGVVNLVAGAGEVGAALLRTRASTASPSPARSRPARRSATPAWTALPASTSRWAGRTPSSSAPTWPISSTSPPAAAPGPQLPQRRPGLHFLWAAST